jgi:hypothetical protein
MTLLRSWQKVTVRDHGKRTNTQSVGVSEGNLTHNAMNSLPAEELMRLDPDAAAGIAARLPAPHKWPPLAWLKKGRRLLHQRFRGKISNHLHLRTTRHCEFSIPVASTCSYLGVSSPTDSRTPQSFISSPISQSMPVHAWKRDEKRAAVPWVNGTVEVTTWWMQWLNPALLAPLQDCRKLETTARCCHLWGDLWWCRSRRHQLSATDAYGWGSPRMQACWAHQQKHANWDS